jgi:acyl carrier protein
MESTDIKGKIKVYILENFLYGASSDQIADDDSFLEKGIIDSTGILELVAFIEETFAVKVADEDLVPENMDSINKVGEFILSKTVQV